MQPLLSIVIANYNYGRFLEEAIQSVVSQGMGDDVELIICDAASTDNSVEIIKKYANGLPPNASLDEWLHKPSNSQTLKLSNSQTPISWWCSEKDGGQSAAFNKGFSHARGKYLTWLNADDLLVSGCLKKVVASMKKHPECEWFTGNFYRFTQDGSVIEIGWGPNFYPKFLQRRNSPLVVFGPSSFFSKKIFEKYGQIDESLHYIMDNDLWHRFIRGGVIQRRIPVFCWGFRMHEDSKTAEFGSHVVSPDTTRKMREEVLYSLRKTGYSASKYIHRMLLLFRCLDGSLIVRFWFKMTFKRVGAR